MSKRFDPDERERKRLHLLEVAASEFARLGFDGANINTISELAGFGKGTVYLYSASKEQLFLDVLHEIGVQTRKALDESLAESEGATLPIRLCAVSEAFVRLAELHPDFIRLQASALFGVNRQFQSTAASVLRQVVLDLTHTFEVEAAHRAMRPVAPGLLAVLLLGMLQTFVLLPDALGFGWQSGDEKAAFLIDVLWKGLAPPAIGMPPAPVPTPSQPSPP